MSQNAQQSLRIEDLDGITVVHFLAHEISEVHGESNDVSVLKAKLEYLIERNDADLLLDLELVEFTVTYFVGVLIALQSRLRKRGRQLRLCGLHGQLEATFQVCKLVDYFEIFPDVPTALAAMTARC